jgi:AbrB family looped-hinge helix DNA binding protein
LGTVISLTRKRQLTIPKAVRDQLGLRPFDRIEVVVDGEEARLRKARFALEELAGSLPALDIPIEEMPTIAKEERAKRFAAKLRGDE